MRDDLPEDTPTLATGTIDRSRLDGEAPDTFDTPPEADHLEAGLPEKGVVRET